MIPKLVQQTIAIHILPNISRKEDNQTITFGQLIEDNIRKISVEKSFRKCDGETVTRTISKKNKLRYISGSIVESFKKFRLIV